MAPAASRSPHRPGLYDSRFEHDACGVGFVADLSGRRTHDTVAQALTVLRNLDHRGRQGQRPGYRRRGRHPDPDPGRLVPRGLRVPPARRGQLRCRAGLPARRCAECAPGPGGGRGAGRRRRGCPSWAGGTCPHDAAYCGTGARAAMPRLAQLFVAARRTARAGSPWTGGRSACASGSSTRPACTWPACPRATIVYKGMLTALQLTPFYPDLSDPGYASALALVHSRFSTNTFPSWPLAHPYRFIAHNGEINTVRGNRNWMRAREAMLATDLFPAAADGRGIERLLPILDRGGQRLGQLRRVPGTAAPGRPVAAARRAHDDPRAVGEPRGDGPGAAGVLPVPRRADGALGRPGLRRVHRRHHRRRGARPQRAAPGPVLGDPGRPGHPGQRGRRARPRPGHGGAQGTAAAGPDLPGRHRQPPACSRTPT